MRQQILTGAEPGPGILPRPAIAQRRLFPLLILPLLFALPLLAFAVSTVRAQQAAPPKNISDDASVLLTVRYADAARQPLMQLLPHELFLLAGEKEFGVDMAQLERISIFVKPPDQLMGNPLLEMTLTGALNFVLEFSEDQNPDGRILDQLVQGEFEGKTAWSPTVPDGLVVPSLIQIDARTYLIAIPDEAEKCIAGLKDGGMKKLLDAVPANDHADLYIDLAGMREFIREFLPPKDRVPMMVSRYYEILDLASGITAREGFETNGVAEIIIQANNEPDARRLEQLLIDAVDLGKQAALSGLALMPPDEFGPEYQSATLDFATRVSESLKEAIAASRDGDKLVIDLRKTFKNSGPAIAAVMAGAVIPATLQVREAARRVESSNKLRQIVLACLNYESAMTHWPARAICDEDGNPLLSWRVAILPYLEGGQDLYDQFHLDEPWDSEHNIQLLAQIPDLYKCPDFDLGPDTVDLGIRGEGMVFGDPEPVTFADIADGSSNTIIFVEADPAASVPWSKPADLEVDPDRPDVNLGGFREAGFLAAMMDGSVTKVGRVLDEGVLRQLFQYNDGGR